MKAMFKDEWTEKFILFKFKIVVCTDTMVLIQNDFVKWHYETKHNQFKIEWQDVQQNCRW